MVGFKTFWITLLSLLFVAACVPQTKQTSCSSNEAFNSSLRSCVPVMQGPSSFINITSYSPTSSLSKYKNDGSPITLSVTISNPYALSFSVQWERIYGGVAYSINPTTSTTTTSAYVFAPATLATQLGTHLFNVKILDSTGVIVDTHSFEVNISDLPKPYITAGTVTPPGYSLTVDPTAADQVFSFSIANNNAIIVGAGYQTDWTIYKNGVLIAALSESDAFSVTAPSGTNTASFTFNPDGATNGIGTYVLYARVVNSAAQIVDERSWAITVKTPDLPFITSRNIYSGSSTPAFSTSVVAYHGLAYNSVGNTAYNFIPASSPAGQANFCVTLTTGQGTYTTDALYTRVDYYLDNTTLIYSGKTSAVSNQVCLSSAGAAVLSTVSFSNTVSSATQSHTLTARVVDEATNQEYGTANMSGSLGSYPISWNIEVRPVNSAPTITFNAGATSCAAAVGTSKTCSVTQDVAFTVGFTATDDFYDTSSTTDAQQAHFGYTMTLYRNNVAISTCTKTTADVANTNVPNSDFVGPDYFCTFTVSSHGAPTGAYHPSPTDTYYIGISMSDDGSPLTGSSAATTATYTYQLTVTEANTAPSALALGAQGTNSYLTNASAPAVTIATIPEGDTLNFNVRVQDTERDNHQIQIQLCTDFALACTTTSGALATQSVTKSDDVLTTLTTLTYTLPEDLIRLSSTPNVASITAYFKVTVTDVPDVVAGLTGTTVFSITVTDKNPAPQFGGTPSPAIAASLKTFVGFPLTIDPGTVTDASVPASENTISYQWWIDADGPGGGTFSSISGSTSRVLVWTPSSAIAEDTVVYLRLCAGDGTTMNPLPTTGAAAAAATTNPATGSNCIGNWSVTVKPNLIRLLADTGAGTNSNDINSDMAVWYEAVDTAVDVDVNPDAFIVYSAYSDSAGYINIEKTFIDRDGKVYNSSATGFKTVRFYALSTGTVDVTSIKDLSITSDSSYVYVAYQAADTVALTPKIRVRRIDKTGTKSDTSFPDSGKFGFFYDKATASHTVTTTAGAGVVDLANAATNGSATTITFGAAMANGNTVTVEGVAFTAADVPTTSQLCSSSYCDSNANAARLASFINTSNNRALQGITASAAGSVVTLVGGNGGDHTDSTASVTNYTVGKLGKIAISGGNWYLPFTDLTTAGSLNKIKVMSLSTASALSAAVTVSAALDLDNGAGTDTVNWFTSDVDASGNLVIASVDTSNVARLSLFTFGNATATSSMALFSSNPISASTLRLGAKATGNLYTFAVAKVLTALPATYEWYIGQYNVAAGTGSAYKFNQIGYNAATTTALNDGDISDVTIQAMPSSGTSTEARLLVSSDDGGAQVNIYPVRFRSDNTLSCSYCVPLNTSTQQLSSSKRIVSLPIYHNTNVALGTAGSSSTPTENIRELLFTLYAVDANSDSIYEQPILGVLNANTETIQSTSTDATGTVAHRPPFFGTN